MAKSKEQRAQEEAQELSEFVDELDEIPFRESLSDGTETHIISVAYEGCQTCEHLANREKDPDSIRGKVKVYDLVDLAKYVSKDGTFQEKDIKTLKEYQPYLEIRACDFHLPHALRECYTGMFSHRDNGFMGKEPLIIDPFDNVLIHIEHPCGFSDLIISEKIYSTLAHRSAVLEAHFLKFKALDHDS